MAEETRSNENMPLPTVLFVDDEALSLKYFKASIGPFAKVLTADSAAAAREILDREGSRISVVVSDERMPHEAGSDFLCDVRKSLPSAVLVLTSAFADFDGLQRAINEANIYRFVPKPWNLDELDAAIRGAIEEERGSPAPKAPDKGAAPSFSEDASVELMGLLARELDGPLHAISNQSLTIAAMATMHDILPRTTKPSGNAKAVGEIARTVATIEKDVHYCKALAASIMDLTAKLNGGDAETASMAEAATCALEQVAERQAGRRRITLDARQDFASVVPRRVMSFVLANVLMEAERLPLEDGPGPISMVLAKGTEFNDVRITVPAVSLWASEKTRIHRINRAALWAFAGQLLFSSDMDAGTSTTTIRLPACD